MDGGRGTFDAIVVGGRCAGAATALLLARRGLDVLVLDRARLPSDTISGHMIKPPGVAALERWGLRGAVEATGCPPITERRVVIGGERLPVPQPPAGTPPALAPRRHILDALLLEAAEAAGARVRTGAAVLSLLRDGERVTGVRWRLQGGPITTARARLVIGADGRNSLVARAAGAAVTRDLGVASLAYYAYWAGVERGGLSLFVEPGVAVGIFPTHDEQVLAFVQAPVTRRRAFARDVEAGYAAGLASVPAASELLAGGRRTGRIVGMAQLPTFFRGAHGPGWALVGDAGHHKDPFVARGIADAWRDAELLTNALVSAWEDGDGALAGSLAEGYEQVRDRASGPVAELNVALARLDGDADSIRARFVALAVAERDGEHLAAAAIDAGSRLRKSE